MVNLTIEKPMELDERAKVAKLSKDEMERLIDDFKAFLHARVYRYAFQSDESQKEEMFGTAMMAFYESIQKYDAEKGHFFPFANKIVCERLIDYNRKAFRSRGATVPLEDEDEDQTSSQSAAINKISVHTYEAQRSQESLVEEIEQLKAELSVWGITMASLARQSPKHKKLREEYKMIVSTIIQAPDIIQTIQIKRYFPIKAISAISGLPPKKLERARNFILASVIIKMGDYQYLSEYLN